MPRTTVAILTVLLGIIALGTLVSAHHSRAMFDTETLVSVEGVVTDVQWRNPHMWVKLDVPGENGKTESWGFEGSAPPRWWPPGSRRRILKVRNKVKIIAHPGRDKSARIAEFMGMEVNGRYYSRGTGSNIRTSGQK